MKLVAILFAVVVAQLYAMPQGQNGGGPVTPQDIKEVLEENGLGCKLWKKFKDLIDQHSSIDEVKEHLFKGLDCKKLIKMVEEELKSCGFSDEEIECLKEKVCEYIHNMKWCDLVPILEDIFAYVSSQVINYYIKNGACNPNDWKKGFVEFVEKDDAPALICQKMGEFYCNMTPGQLMQEGKKLLFCLIERVMSKGQEGGQIDGQMVLQLMDCLGLKDCLIKKLQEALQGGDAKKMIEDCFKNEETIKMIKQIEEELGISVSKDEILQILKTQMDKMGCDKIAEHLLCMAADKLACCINEHLMEEVKPYIEEEIKDKVTELQSDEGCLKKFLKEIFCPKEIAHMAYQLLKEAFKDSQNGPPPSAN